MPPPFLDGRRERVVPHRGYRSLRHRSNATFRRGAASASSCQHPTWRISTQSNHDVGAKLGSQLQSASAGSRPTPLRSRRGRLRTSHRSRYCLRPDRCPVEAATPLPLIDIVRDAGPPADRPDTDVAIEHAPAVMAIAGGAAGEGGHGLYNRAKKQMAEAARACTRPWSDPQAGNEQRTLAIRTPMRWAFRQTRDRRSEAHRSIPLLPDQLFSLARLSIVSMADCQSSSEADPSVSSSLTRFFNALDA
jgi:hypothetical protein